MSKPHLHVLDGGLSKRRNLANDDVWFAELKRLERKARMIRMLRVGDATVKKIHVKQSGWIKRHRRAAHDRLVIVLNKDKNK